MIFMPIHTPQKVSFLPLTLLSNTRITGHEDRTPLLAAVDGRNNGDSGVRWTLLSIQQDPRTTRPSPLA